MQADLKGGVVIENSGVHLTVERLCSVWPGLVFVQSDPIGPSLFIFDDRLFSFAVDEIVDRLLLKLLSQLADYYFLNIGKLARDRRFFVCNFCNMEPELGSEDIAALARLKVKNHIFEFLHHCPAGKRTQASAVLRAIGVFAG